MRRKDYGESENQLQSECRISRYIKVSRLHFAKTLPMFPVMCNAKNFVAIYEYKKLTKINYKVSIAQYIDFVKFANPYIEFSADLQKNRNNIYIYY